MVTFCYINERLFVVGLLKSYLLMKGLFTFSVSAVSLSEHIV